MGLLYLIRVPFYVQPLLTRSLDQLLWQRAMDPRVMRYQTADINVN